MKPPARTVAPRRWLDRGLGAFWLLFGLACLGGSFSVLDDPMSRRYGEAILIPGFGLVTLGTWLIANSFRTPRRPSAT